MVQCLTGAKFSMNAEVLNWTGITEGGPDDTVEGEWVTYQDPITLEIRNRWVVPTATPDNPNTPENEYKPKTIQCFARGIVTTGVKTSANMEDFGNWYRDIEMVQMWVPAKVAISKRDRVTNIRERKGGKIVWVDEEYLGPESPRPTVFNVTGVTPLFDPFNRHIQSLVLLEKVD